MNSAYDEGYSSWGMSTPANGLEKLGQGIYQWANNALTGDLDYRRETVLNEVNNAFNAQQSQLARDWQSDENRLAWERSEQSAKNAYDRDVEAAKNAYSWKIADLKKNGINPYVALTGGAGSVSSPAGQAHSSSGSSAYSAGAHASHSGQGVINALASLISSAFSLAARADTPSNYTDYYSDKNGYVKGSRSRVYG